MIAGLDLQAFGGETGGTMAGRRTKRSDGRFCLNMTVENADGTRRRVYFYGRTQAEARAKVAAARERVGRGEPLAFVVVTVIAFFAILFTTRYPQGLFDLNVGVLRW
ncbi:MAG TPA: hypothetical protein VKB85_15475 [Propionibacteriaceae bacterium]|nr:hypothetical protein [Propionibacteriaceae bacterium]